MDRQKNRPAGEPGSKQSDWRISEYRFVNGQKRKTEIQSPSDEVSINADSGAGELHRDNSF